MKKQLNCKVTIDSSVNCFSYSFTDIINKFHVGLIEKELNNSDFSIEDKLMIIDRIIEELKSREIDGIIK